MCPSPINNSPQKLQGGWYKSFFTSNSLKPGHLPCALQCGNIWSLLVTGATTDVLCLVGRTGMFPGVPSRVSAQVKEVRGIEDCRVSNKAHFPGKLPRQGKIRD